MIKNILIAFTVLLSTKISAQFITAEIGGAGFYCPSIGFEYIFQADTTAYANGTKFKIGAGYGDWQATQPLGVVRMAIHQVWGKRGPTLSTPLA